MKKIPTIFERDWNGDKSRVVDQVNPKAQWVFDGEGWATRKLDGTSCMIRNGTLFKRRELKQNDPEPFGFVLADRDEETGKVVGWVEVGNGSEDRRHIEAFAALATKDDGTYELVGPKVQGNPEAYADHKLVPHDAHELLLDGNGMPRVPVTFEGLRIYLPEHDYEGIVWHHPDGRMAKIKARDFGIKRKKP